jgi:hypothetical protein
VLRRHGPARKAHLVAGGAGLAALLPRRLQLRLQLGLQHGRERRFIPPPSSGLQAPGVLGTEPQPGAGSPFQAPGQGRLAGPLTCSLAEVSLVAARSEVRASSCAPRCAHSAASRVFLPASRSSCSRAAAMGREGAGWCERVQRGGVPGRLQASARCQVRSSVACCSQA